VSERGRTCRKVDRRRGTADEDLDVDLTRDEAVVRVRGRVVRTLTGADVDAVRAVDRGSER
jgi:hypothetical protein